MRESIRGYTDAVLEDAAESDALSELADGVSGFNALLGSSDDLRVVLADPGLPAHVRRGVINDLLSSQVGEQALRAIVYLIEVDRAPEFSDDMAWLADRVEAARDDLVPVGELPLGRVAATERIDGYASAVFEGAREDDSLGEIEDELFRFSRSIDGSAQLTEALTDVQIPVEARAGVVRDLLADRATPSSVRLAGYTVRAGRPRDFPSLLTALVERVAEEAQRQIAEVRAPVDLTEDQQRRLADALGRIVGHDVDVRVIVDPRVLGGFVANIGESVIDGSARHRLEQLRDRLVLPDSNITT